MRLIALVTLAAGLACSGPSIGPTSATAPIATLNFVVDSASANCMSGIPQCTNCVGQLYCYYEAPSSGGFRLVLTLDAQQNLVNDSPCSGSLSGFTCTSNPGGESGCGGVTAFTTTTADSLKGTFSATTNCHGASQRGRIVGTFTH